ncbi:uncharacterized protein LOC114363641 [Ostrinia furnacalis]|uniref:uncharacterized protein LOC114363641 n=1 Tax=Ostrinia furnacalis TaxID=93504 RepID=UPI00103AD215|nr:uncharacterized protein LOC114363641 [Ostrinia furnacalis]
MISSVNYKKVKIHITTFQNEDTKSKTKMDKEKCKHSLINAANRRFICAMCLNSNNTHNCNEDHGKIARPCPICRKKYDNINKRSCDHTKVDKKDTVIHTYDHSKECSLSTNLKDKSNADNKHSDKRNEINERNMKTKILSTKIVQTSQTDLTQDLSLLKEVLTVFQSKKLDIKSNNSKTVVMKDVSVATESQSKIDLKPKLTMSRIFQLSIDETSNNNGNNFKIVNYSQPTNAKSSHFSIDLIKHKSSSIPQMKVEELKYSLKEKTKSKDAIEEVNRMFATVRRHQMSKNLDDPNRPLIRNGPRVLPVVKTNTYQENTKENSDSELENKPVDTAICKCCQTNDLQLSAGDSIFKHECCYHKMLQEGKCEKCVYMLCCHYQNHSKVEAGALICEHYRNPSEEKQGNANGGCNHCEHF